MRLRSSREPLANFAPTLPTATGSMRGHRCLSSQSQQTCRLLHSYATLLTHYRVCTNTTYQNQTGAVFVNSTIRQTLYMTTSAHQVRLKFSNVFGGSNLPITAVTVALPVNQTAGIYQVQPQTVQKVTFGGKDGISVPNGALAVSDPINFEIKAQQIVTVTMYLASRQTASPAILAPELQVGGNSATQSPQLVSTSATLPHSPQHIGTFFPPSKPGFNRVLAPCSLLATPSLTAVDPQPIKTTDGPTCSLRAFKRTPQPSTFPRVTWLQVETVS